MLASFASAGRRIADAAAGPGVTGAPYLSGIAMGGAAPIHQQDAGKAAEAVHAVAAPVTGPPVLSICGLSVIVMDASWPEGWGAPRCRTCVRLAG